MGISAIQAARSGRLIALGAFLAILSPSWSEAGEVKGVLGASAYYGALVGGDWLTTRGAMRRGYTEANPVIQHFGFSASKAAGGALMVGGDYALRHHRKAQWGLRAVSGAFYGWAMLRATKAR